MTGEKAALMYAAYFNNLIKVWTIDDNLKFGHQQLTDDGFIHFNKSLLHRLDGPALEFPGFELSDGTAYRGTTYWFAFGKIHRSGGPAIEWSDGSKEWYVNGKKYREEKSAICEWFDGLPEPKPWSADEKLLSTEKVKTWISENNIDLTDYIDQMCFDLMWK